MISDHPSSYISYSSWWNIKDYINSNPAVFVFIKITTATMAPTLDFHQIWKLLKRVIRKYIVGVIFILFPVFLSNESFQPLLYYTSLYYNRIATKVCACHSETGTVILSEIFVTSHPKMSASMDVFSPYTGTPLDPVFHSSSPCHHVFRGLWPLYCSWLSISILLTVKFDSIIVIANVYMSCVCSA